MGRNGPGVEMATEEELMTNPRREFLLKAVDVAQLKGLEIGALNSPLVKKEDLRTGGEIFYLDHLPTNELRDKYKDDKSVSIDEIVPVDFVCRDGDIIKATSGNTFDYVVASHVIEHAPNLLRFLSDIQNILKPDGACILIVPDKRFTFDLNRPSTTFGEVLEKFLKNETRPNLSVVYDHFSMSTHANGHNIWYGIDNEGDTRSLVSDTFAWDAAHRVYEESCYLDVHVNIFTPASFFSILKKSINHEIVFFKVDKFIDTQVGQIEFSIILKKPAEKKLIEQKSTCVNSIPKIPVESLLAPYMPQVRSLSEALKQVIETNSGLQLELEKRQTAINEKAEQLLNLKAELDAAESVLNRRSIKFVLVWVDRLFRLIRPKKG